MKRMNSDHFSNILAVFTLSQFRFSTNYLIQIYALRLGCFSIVYLFLHHRALQFFELNLSHF